ncbi:hypothetical protein K1X76_00075 [bacterium]|nr:hypothetical protein [bacterium]
MIKKIILLFVFVNILFVVPSQASSLKAHNFKELHFGISFPAEWTITPREDGISFKSHDQSYYGKIKRWMTAKDEKALVASLRQNLGQSGKIIKEQDKPADKNPYYLFHQFVYEEGEIKTAVYAIVTKTKTYTITIGSAAEKFDLAFVEGLAGTFKPLE